MFIFHLLSTISILLLLFTSLQLTWTITTQDDKDIYSNTPLGDNNGGSGNVQVKVDKKVNVHVSNSGNGGSGGHQIFEKLIENVPEETVRTKDNITTRKIKLADSVLPSSDIDRYLLLTNSRRRRSVTDDHSKNEIKTKSNTSFPVHLNGSESKSSG
jgi:hypothetical protein